MVSRGKSPLLPLPPQKGEKKEKGRNVPEWRLRGFEEKKGFVHG